MQAKPFAIVAIVGAGLYALIRHLRQTVDSSPAASSSATARPSYPMPTEQRAAIHRGAAEVMRPAFVQANGREASSDELIYCLAVANLETSYGRGWTKCRCKTVQCDMAGAQASNNWGAVQAKAGGFQWCDTKPDSTEYAQKFRSYATPIDGAAHTAKHVIGVRPEVEAALSGPNASVWRASLAMRRTSYYGSWCTKAVKQYGSAVAKAAAQRTPSTAGDYACEREAAAQHVAAVMKRQAEIAPSLGLSGIPEGTYEDAKAWYESGRKVAAS